MDRASDSGPGGRGFNSRHTQMKAFLFKKGLFRFRQSIKTTQIIQVKNESTCKKDSKKQMQVI